MPDASASSEETVTVSVNGKPVVMPRGSVLAAAILNSGSFCRISESGEARMAICGMGICFECRAIVDGAAQRRTCQIVCCDGMTVHTHP
jgi:sarcosine oxidase subunit alpha